MENIELEEKILKIKEFKKKNLKVLIEWEKITSEAKDTLFKASCLKDYLKSCEPFYCSFRITGVCKYPEKFTELEKIIKI